MDRGAWQASVLGVTKELDTTESDPCAHRVVMQEMRNPMDRGAGELQSMEVAESKP